MAQYERKLALGFAKPILNPKICFRAQSTVIYSINCDPRKVTQFFYPPRKDKKRLDLAIFLHIETGSLLN